MSQWAVVVVQSTLCLPQVVVVVGKKVNSVLVHPHALPQRQLHHTLRQPQHSEQEFGPKESLQCVVPPTKSGQEVQSQECVKHGRAVKRF